MGSLSGQYISQSFVSLIHLGNNSVITSSFTELQDGLGNGLGVSVNALGEISASGNIYGLNITGSTGTIDTGSFATTGSNTFTGAQTITGSNGILTYTGTSAGTIDGALASIHANDDSPWLERFYNDTFSTGSSVMSYFAWNDGRFIFHNDSTASIGIGVNGYDNPQLLINENSASVKNDLNVGGTFRANQIDVSTGSIEQTTGSYVMTFSGSGLMTYATYQDVAKEISLYLTGSTIETGSFATTGSNTFIGDQTIVGNVTFPSGSFISSNNVSGNLYFSALNGGTLHLNDDGGEGDVVIGYIGSAGKLKVRGNSEFTGSQTILSGSIAVLNNNNAASLNETELSIETYTNDAYGIIAANNHSASLGIVSWDGATYDNELWMQADTGGIRMTDWDNGIGNISQTPFMSVGANDGSQPAPILNRGLVTHNAIKGTGSITLQPDLNDSRSLGIYNTSATDTHITASGGNLFLGNDETYVLVTTYANQKEVSIRGDQGITASGSLDISGSLTASLQQGYVWVGDSNNTTALVSTSSFVSSGAITASSLITASVNVNVITFTKGDNTTFSLTVAASGSVAAGTVSGSAQIIGLGFLQTSSFQTYTGSQDTKNTAVGASTSSLNSFTASAQTSINALNTFTASQSTASLVTSITNLNTFTSSQLTINSAIGASTSSLNTFSSSVLTQLNTLANVTSSLISKTGSYATTGSNSFVGNQTITGNITAFSASFTYLQTIYESSSIIYSSGSNQFGDELSDIQTLSGSVKVQGSLTVNGTPVSTSSVDISALNAFTSSQLTINSAIGASTSSLNTATSSLFTSSSLALTTASVSLNTITFTKGNGTTFNVTVNTGSAGAAFPYTGSADISGSLRVIGEVQMTGSSASNSTVVSINQANTYPIAITGRGNMDFGLFISGSTLSADPSAAIRIIDSNRARIVMANTVTTNDKTHFYIQSNGTSRVGINGYTGTTIGYTDTNAANPNAIYISASVANDSDKNFIGFNANPSSYVGTYNYAFGAMNTATGSRTIMNGHLYVSQSFTASLQNGYAWVGNSTGYNVQVATSSFATAIPTGTVSGSAQITAFGFVSGSYETTGRGIVSGSSQVTPLLPTGVVSGSAQTIANLPTGTVSGSQQITSLGFVSSSVTASSLVTASFSGNTLTFTKGDATTFGIVLPDVSGSTINTGSFVTTASFNDYTASQSTSSLVTSITQLNTATASLFTSASLSLTTASFAGNTLTFRKGDGTTFGVVIPDVSGSTGGATLGANTFTGSQTISSSLNVSGSANFVGGDVNFTDQGRNINIDVDRTIIKGQKPTLISSSLDISGSLTASLANGFTYVGNGSNRTTLVATSSFATNVSNLATTGSNAFFGTNTFSGAVAFTGSAPTILSSSFSGSIITNLTDTYTDVSAVQQIVTLTSASYAALASGSLTNPNTLYIVSGSTSGSITGATLGSNTFSGSQIFTGSVQGNVVSMSIASATASMDLNTGNYFTLSIPTGTTRIATSNIKSGTSATLVITTASGSLVTFDSSVKQPSGSAYVPTSGSVDVLSFVSVNSSNLYVVSTKNMI